MRWNAKFTCGSTLLLTRLDRVFWGWRNKLNCKIRGGVGVPVGFAVFKTAGGPLGAVSGGFDSHTSL